MKKILVLGIGNDILQDDGIGIRLVRDLSRMEDFPQGIQFETTTLGGLEIVEIIRDYEKVIIIDAIKTANGVPGDISCYSPADFRETLHLTNLHDINFLTSLELAKRVGIRIPEEVRIIAVEIIEDREFGADLTPEMKEKYPGILSSVSRIVASCL